MKNGLEEAFCQKLKKKKPTNNILSVCRIVVFLLASKGKKTFDQILDSDLFLTPNTESKLVLLLSWQLNKNQRGERIFRI